MEKQEKEKSMLKISTFILQTLIRAVQISSVITSNTLIRAESATLNPAPLSEGEGS
jgi:hypothetical protein